MKIALLALDGFNEIDTFLACTLLNRVSRQDWQVALVCPTPSVRSLNGVVVQAQQALNWLPSADAVLFGSGCHSLRQSQDQALLAQIRLTPERQLLGTQCSGALLLAALGLLHGPVCTDAKTRPLLEALGFDVLNQPFYVQDQIASAGGCLAAQYLACWLIGRLLGLGAVQDALAQISPVGQEASYYQAVLAQLAHDPRLLS